MAFAFEAASRSFAGPYTTAKAIQWRDEGDNCEQRCSDVNATSHPVLKHIKPRKGRDIVGCPQPYQAAEEHGPALPHGKSVPRTSEVGEEIILDDVVGARTRDDDANHDPQQQPVY